MPENDNNTGPDLPGIILNSDQVKPFHAKLIEDQYGAHGVAYDFETEYPNLPKGQDPSHEAGSDAMIAAKYRAAIITQLLEKGSLGYQAAQQACREKGLTIIFMPEAFRVAYQEVLDYAQGRKKLPKVKEEEE